jgi:tRNA(Arg) A34 adenosine deaminase TadA
MRIAIEEAKTSLREGNKGFGAVLVKNGRIIARAHDEEITKSDLTSHAEMNVIREGSKRFGRNLEDFILISTHEPCPMCATATIWANISEIVYGISISEAMRLGRERIQLTCKEIIKRVPGRIKTKIKGGVLKKECLVLYDEAVRRLIQKFKIAAREKSWEVLENELIEKRLKWFRKNKRNLNLEGDDLEKAYQLILKKIGIKPKEAPIWKKTKTQLIFHSKNFCPALVACKILGLDARRICKLVFEKPTQELIKKINPNLKFSRNYKKIRPYTNYCEEIIKLI